MTNKLLRDAIADANVVRETALAHAKAALEEAFTPHITSMLSARLRNEADNPFADDAEADDELEELNDPVAGDGHGTEDGGETDVDAVQSSSHTGDQNVTEDVDDKVDHDAEGLKSSEIATEPTQKYGTSSPRDPAGPASAATSPGDTDNEGLMQPAGTKVSEGIFEDDDEMDPEAGGIPGLDALGGGEEEEEPDLDLEAIIAELEADMVSEMGDGDDYMDELPGEEEEEPVMEQNDAEVSDGHGPGEGGEKDASVTADSTFTQGPGDKQTTPISEQEEEGEDEKELDLDEILKEIELEESQGTLQNENSRMRKELKEYQRAVKFLRSKLNEVSMLNAKLLYTNTLFKKYSMTGRQKMRVIESFDRASNVREAKLVYTTLAESFKGKPVTRKTRKITEGLASRAGGSTKPSGASLPGRQTVLTEGEDMVTRFQKLAGINKS